MEKIAQLPFLFIAGRPRSGTTLLRTLFDAHSQVIIPPECQFVVNLYGKYGKKNRWTEEDLRQFYNDLQPQWRFDLWKLDNDKLMSSLLSCAGQNSYGTICKAVYNTYESVFPKGDIMLFGDKNPGYTIYTRRLLKIFPNAKFIHITRDYRDNFDSIKNVDFELPLPSLAAQKWVYFHKKIHADARKAPERYYHLRYEDLVSDPETVMKKLCSFAGIPYEPGILNFHEKKDEVKQMYDASILEKYHASLLNKVNTSRIGRYKTTLTEKEIRMLDLVAGKQGSMAGYETEYKNASPVLFLQAVPGRFLAATLYMATQVVDRFPPTLRMNILSKGPRVLGKAFLRVFNPKKLAEINKLEKGKKQD